MRNSRAHSLYQGSHNSSGRMLGEDGRAAIHKPLHGQNRAHNIGIICDRKGQMWGRAGLIQIPGPDPRADTRSALGPLPSSSPRRRAGGNRKGYPLLLYLLGPAIHIAYGHSKYDVSHCILWEAQVRIVRSEIITVVRVCQSPGTAALHLPEWALLEQRCSLTPALGF